MIILLKKTSNKRIMKKIGYAFIMFSIAALYTNIAVVNAQGKQSITELSAADKFHAENTGSLSFFVRDAENGYGINSQINISGNGKEYSMESNESGHVIFINKEGRYDVTFNAGGHNSLHTYFYIEHGNTINIQVNMDRINRTPVNDENISGALIEGFVIDFATGQPISGITVFMGEQKKTTSDMKGHFSIFSNEYSVINNTEDRPVRKSFTFSAPGYSSFLVENLLLVSTKISINIALQKGQGQEIENCFQHVLDDTQKDAEIYEQNNSAVDNNSENKSNNSVTTASGCTVPTTIRVGISCSCTTCSSVSVMSLQTYTEKGIDNEWIPSWNSNSISAGSVAYRTYGAWYVNHPVKTNFDIASSTCNQAWGSAVYANCQVAALATVGMVLTMDGVNPARSEYSAENNGLGAAASTSCGNCKSGTGNTYPCFSDNLCCGKTRSGHGRGMCQWGTQRWALGGQNYSWIIDHYFTIGNMTVCGTVSSSCGTPSGLSAGSITSGSANLNWAAVSGAVSYNIKYKLTSSSIWTSITSVVTNKSISSLVTSGTYEFQVQAVCSNTGSFSASALFTTLAPAPVNDNCANAQSLTPNAACIQTAGSLAGATASGLPKASCDASTTHTLADVWYKFQAASTKHTITVTPNSGLDIVLSLYTSCSGSQLGCSDNGGGNGGVEKIAAANLVIGTTYYVRIYSYGSAVHAASNFSICITTQTSLLKSFNEPADEIKSNDLKAENIPFSIYPNPFDGLIIHGKAAMTDEESTSIKSMTNITVYVFDLYGKELFSKMIPFENGEFTLSFDDKFLKPGIYALLGKTFDNRIFRKRICVE